MRVLRRAHKRFATCVPVRSVCGRRQPCLVWLMLMKFLNNKRAAQLKPLLGTSSFTEKLTMGKREHNGEMFDCRQLLRKLLLHSVAVFCGVRSSDSGTRDRETGARMRVLPHGAFVPLVSYLKMETVRECTLWVLYGP